MDALQTQNSSASGPADAGAAGQQAADAAGAAHADHAGSTPPATSDGAALAGTQTDGSKEKPAGEGSAPELTAEQKAKREQELKAILQRDQALQAREREHRVAENAERARGQESAQQQSRLSRETGKLETSSHPLLSAINSHQAKYIERLRKLLHSHGIGVPDMDDFDPQGEAMAPLKP